MQEQERMIIEEQLEEKQRQELEERTTEDVFPVSEPKDASYGEDPMTGEITDQEKEEKPYDVTDDESRVSSSCAYPERLQ